MHVSSTSHFIGLIFPPNNFVDLFLKLNECIDKHDLHTCVDVQNIHSMHATLYYFESSIPREDLKQIEHFIADTQKEISGDSISLSGYDYFKRDWENNILYLKPEYTKIWNLHTALATQFQRDAIVDNQLSFVPHVTLLRIYDAHIYEQKKKYIETIIQEFLESEQSKDFETSIQLYAVFSQIKPEMQIPYRK